MSKPSNINKQLITEDDTWEIEEEVNWEQELINWTPIEISWEPLEINWGELNISW